ncbi:hypothetical protein COP05_10530 [Dermabacter jinjuensis]|uniref:Uncharacterized protein n=1 Tax=Dermabacter jinjuensis TaxID=1667168 RepID=A0ABN5DQA9_9MICO|nr:hypothetical protein COP05_10530 [Dermabacter jinjuensis]
MRAGEVCRRGPRILDGAGLLPGEVAGGAGNRGNTEDDEDGADLRLLLVGSGARGGGGADLGRALLPFGASGIHGGGDGRAEGRVRGVRGAACAGEVVSLEIAAELASARADVAIEFIGKAARKPAHACLADIEAFAYALFNLGGVVAVELFGALTRLLRRLVEERPGVVECLVPRALRALRLLFGLLLRVLCVLLRGLLGLALGIGESHR